MLKLLQSLDIYGHSISVLYKGEDSYKTRLGGLVTLVTYILGLINFYNLAVQFIDKSAQKEVTRTVTVDTLDMEPLSLSEQNFKFLISSNSPVPARIGSWHATQRNFYKRTVNPLTVSNAHCTETNS